MYIRALLLTAALLGAGSSALAADFLVYRGTYRETQPADAAKVLVGKCFVVFGLPAANDSAGQIGFVSYFVQPTGVNKGRKVVALSPAIEGRFGGVTQPNGKELRTISHANSQIVGAAFVQLGHYFRGVQVAIPLRPNGTNPPFTINEPARLTGHTFSHAVSIFGPIYYERTFSLMQDGQRTLVANSASGQTVDGISNQLVAYVKTLGYQ
jgi:hypothetical protein